MGHIDGICVIVAAYKAEETIGRAVSSALLQREVCEVVVVDDCSPDNTVDAAKQGAQGSSRLRVVRLDKNQGPSAARNCAIESSAAPFFAILDADDEFLPRRFESLKSSDWDIWFDDILFLPPGEVIPSDIRLSSSTSRQERLVGFEEFLISNIGNNKGLSPQLGFMKPVLRRDMLHRLALRYDRTLRLGEDYVLYAQALLGGARMVMSNAVGYIAHVRAGSLSRSHGTRDLQALHDADDLMIRALEADGVSARFVELLRRHKSMLDRRIACRVFLDERKKLGRLRAVLKGVQRPRRFAGIVSDLLRDRREIQSSAVRIRTLLGERSFAADEGQ